jgi:curved DNA-binding protein CbpA
MESRNYYEILEIDRNATLADIKKAYHKAARQWHPDKNTRNEEVAETKFKDIHEAYEVLSNPLQRRDYDTSLKVFPHQSTYSSANKNTFYNKNPRETTSGSPQKEDTPNIHLPTAVIFTGKPVKNKNFHVILLGTVYAGKSAFVRNLLQEKLDRFSAIGLDYKIYKPNDNISFLINDMAGMERFDVVMESYFRQASIVLLFDEPKNQLVQCKWKLRTILEQCKIMPLSYTHDSCEFGQAVNLENFEFDQNVAMTSDCPQNAHLLSKQLFNHLEERVLDAALKQPRKHDVIQLEDQPQPQKRPNCC